LLPSKRIAAEMHSEEQHDQYLYDTRHGTA
jgi:hypothetical protein